MQPGDGQGKAPREPHQRGHVAAVHLPNHDLLLRGGHAANVEGLRPAGAGAHHSRQRHRTMLHLPGAIELLLQDGGPAGTDAAVTASWPLMGSVTLPDTTGVSSPHASCYDKQFKRGKYRQSPE